MTVLQGGLALEVTTYRLEGTYSDCRHPDAVRFTRDIIEDLARRDFTINAIAYAPGEGLLDPLAGSRTWPGRHPLRRRPDAADDGGRAAHFCGRCAFPAVLLWPRPDGPGGVLPAGLLARVSQERIASELLQAASGRAAGRVLLEFPQVLAVFLPELEAQLGFDQCNPTTAFDLYTHTARTVAGVPQEAPLRLAALLHDIAKPACFTKDEAGIGHFTATQPRGGDGGGDHAPTAAGQRDVYPRDTARQAARHAD